MATALLAADRSLGGFKLYRRQQGSDRLERKTLHVMDGKHRIALVETRSLDTAGDDPAPEQVVRFQFGNHLGSALVELDDRARTSRTRSTTLTAARPFRPCAAGRRRRSAIATRAGSATRSGLYHQGARYYAPWMARWVAADPTGVDDGDNPYAYVLANPIRLTDPSGTRSDPDTFQAHGKKGEQSPAMTMDIDEPRPVGERGVSASEARARATNVDSRQFLDLLTNRRTKYLGVDTRPIAPPQPPGVGGRQPRGIAHATLERGDRDAADFR